MTEQQLHSLQPPDAAIQSAFHPSQPCRLDPVARISSCSVMRRPALLTYIPLAMEYDSSQPACSSRLVPLSRKAIGSFRFSDVITDKWA